MKLRPRDVLGLAFREGEVACALIDARGRLRGAARFRAGGDLPLDKPDAFGAALRSFLAEHGMGGASTAVAGVPARWLMAEPREVPPSDRAAQLAGLRLAAERLSLGDDTRLVFDVAGAPPAKGGSALLVGLARGRVDQVRQICEAAGLKLAGLTATGLSVAAAVPGTGDRTVVLFDGDGAELVGDGRSGITAFRHVGGASRGAGSPSLRRALALTGGGEVLLLDDSDATACADLAERVHRSVDCRDPSAAIRDVPALASLNGHADAFKQERLWPAVVLAEAGRQRGELPVDFLKPRLAAPKASRFDRRYVIGGAIALLLLLGIGYFYSVVTDAESNATLLEATLDGQAESIAEAEEEVARIGFGKTFFETRPPVLDALADVARVMGREEPVWLTNLAIRDANRVQVQGRAADQRSVLSLRDRLVAEPAFDAVQLTDLREGGGGESGNLTFSLTFAYAPVPPAPASPERSEASR